MTAWLLSVAGVGILGVLVSVLTNKTRLHKVVRTACTYAFLLVLVFPLPSLITSVGSGSCGIFDEAPTYDEEVLDSVVSDGISFHPSSGINPLEEDISFPPEDEFPIPFLHPAKDTVSSKLKSKPIAFFM